MQIFLSYPFAVLTALLLALATMSHAEPQLEALCQARTEANGISPANARRACERL